MSKQRPQLSRLNDHDMRHYQFARSSGLPRGYFNPDRTDRIVLLVCAICLVVALVAVNVWP